MEYARLSTKGQCAFFCSSSISEFCTQGDLTELLGEVPVYEPERPDNLPPGSIPLLPADGNHPYHLVVM